MADSALAVVLCGNLKVNAPAAVHSLTLMENHDMLIPIRKSLQSAAFALAVGVVPVAAIAQGTVPPDGFRFVGDCQLQVFFDTGQTELNTVQEAAIRRFVEEAETSVFEVRGYASTSGDPQTNLALSQARAQAAVSGLGASGVAGVSATIGQSGDGPLFQRDDLLRDACAGAVAEAAPGRPALGVTGVGAGLGLLVILGLAGASSDGT